MVWLKLPKTITSEPMVRFRSSFFSMLLAGPDIETGWVSIHAFQKDIIKCFVKNIKTKHIVRVKQSGCPISMAILAFLPQCGWPSCHPAMTCLSHPHPCPRRRSGDCDARSLPSACASSPPGKSLAPILARPGPTSTGNYNTAAFPGSQ